MIKKPSHIAEKHSLDNLFRRSKWDDGFEGLSPDDPLPEPELLDTTIDPMLDHKRELDRRRQALRYSRGECGRCGAAKDAERMALKMCSACALKQHNASKKFGR